MSHLSPNQVDDEYELQVWKNKKTKKNNVPCATVTFAIKPNTNLGSTTIFMVISEFHKLLNAFLEVMLALITSSGCQPKMRLLVDFCIWEVQHQIFRSKIEHHKYSRENPWTLGQQQQ
jgi:hypothetical protein